MHIHFPFVQLLKSFAHQLERVFNASVIRQTKHRVLLPDRGLIAYPVLKTLLIPINHLQ